MLSTSTEQFPYCSSNKHLSYLIFCLLHLLWLISSLVLKYFKQHYFKKYQNQQAHSHKWLRKQKNQGFFDSFKKIINWNLEAANLSDFFFLLSKWFCGKKNHFYWTSEERRCQQCSLLRQSASEGGKDSFSTSSITFPTCSNERTKRSLWGWQSDWGNMWLAAHSQGRLFSKVIKDLWPSFPAFTWTAGARQKKRAMAPGVY